VLTPDGLVALAPEEIVSQFEQSAGALFEEERANASRMKLVGKREMKRLNTSSSNSTALVREETNYAYLSLEDARRLGVADGDLVEVTSQHGRVQIPARPTDEMMPLTLAIPQCWGHAKAEGLPHARLHPGVNSNWLAGDGPGNIERLSGMSHLSGIVVDVRKVDAPAAG
jgi:formate dehydrogenase